MSVEVVRSTSSAAEDRDQALGALLEDRVELSAQGLAVFTHLGEHLLTRERARDEHRTAIVRSDAVTRLRQSLDA